MGQQTDLCRGGPVQRKSLNQMSQPEIDAFVAAVKAVSNDPANRWGEYAKLHAEVYQGVHVNPKFLPWHRIFVRKMEQFLQEKNPSVTIPYWDWAQYSQNPENDPIFTDRIAGGDGNPGNNDCISNGQFADLKVDYTHEQNSNARCIKRRMTKKDANGLVWTSSDTIDNMLNSASFKDFAESIEQGSHGIIHNCIGSEFAGHASPNDPIFYLHHGFIDKIWYDWQKRNP
ncbi:Di-copper centre-containing protein, partial [Conidiobolus coronatus NRRL 28638]